MGEDAVEPVEHLAPVSFGNLSLHAGLSEIQHASVRGRRDLDAHLRHAGKVLQGEREATGSMDLLILRRRR